jgi:hypothetical protein
VVLQAPLQAGICRPVTLPKRPAGHGVQEAVLAPPELNEPTGHSPDGADRPTVEQWDPAGHATHCTRLPLAEKRPTGHWVAVDTIAVAGQNRPMVAVQFP